MRNDWFNKSSAERHGEGIVDHNESVSALSQQKPQTHVKLSIQGKSSVQDSFILMLSPYTFGIYVWVWTLYFKKKISQKVHIKTSSKNGQKYRKYNLLNPQKGVMRIYRRRYDHICEIHENWKITACIAFPLWTE